MIEIKHQSREFTPVEQYLMTMSPGIITMKNVTDDTEIMVDGYIDYIETKDNGESSDIMAIITPEKEVYAFQSATFKRTIYDISNIMGGKSFPIKKISGITKAGREFVNCVLDVSKLK